jgi:hypothetical protein
MAAVAPVSIALRQQQDREFLKQMSLHLHSPFTIGILPLTGTETIDIDMYHPVKVFRCWNDMHLVYVRSSRIVDRSIDCWFRLIGKIRYVSDIRCSGK